MTPPDDAEWARALDVIARADTILLACHVLPDGDALGSMLGCALGLRRLGRRIEASFPSPFEVPDPFVDLSGLDLLVAPAEAYPAPDLLISFDAASAERLGDLVDRVSSARDVLVIDHHVSNTRFGTIHLVDPAAAATATVVDELLRRLEVPLDAEIAECLYVAVATDTGSFKHSTTTPAVHAFAGRLLSTGIRADEISRRLFDTRPYGALRLLGEVLGRAVLEPEAAGGHGLVWTYATLGDLALHEQRPYVLESLIEVVRSTEEADVACVLKETAHGEWAVSLRSKGALDVRRVAVELGGGGHPSAAGFTGHGDLTEVLAVVHHHLDSDALAAVAPPAAP